MRTKRSIDRRKKIWKNVNIHKLRKVYIFEIINE